MFTSRVGRLFSRDGGRAMSTLQILVLGMMIAWTPSVVVMAIILWRAPDFEETDTRPTGKRGV
jgi:hypothetical protein